KLQACMTEASEKIHEYKPQNPNASREDLVKKIADNRANLGQRLANFLTPDQLPKWDAEVSKAKEFLGQKLAALSNPQSLSFPEIQPDKPRGLSPRVLSCAQSDDNKLVSGHAFSRAVRRRERATALAAVPVIFEDAPHTLPRIPEIINIWQRSSAPLCARTSQARCLRFLHPT